MYYRYPMDNILVVPITQRIVGFETITTCDIGVSIR